MLRERWPAVGRVALLHRTGALAVGECAVVAVVSAPHRDQAFEAARFVIDELKASAPIWKHETWAERCRLGHRPHSPSATAVGSAFVIWVVLGRGRRRDRSVADRPRPSRNTDGVATFQRQIDALSPEARRPVVDQVQQLDDEASDASADARRGGATRWPVTSPSTSGPPTRSCT